MKICKNNLQLAVWRQRLKPRFRLPMLPYYLSVVEAFHSVLCHRVSPESNNRLRHPFPSLI